MEQYEGKWELKFSQVDVWKTILLSVWLHFRSSHIVLRIRLNKEHAPRWE